MSIVEPARTDPLLFLVMVPAIVPVLDTMKDSVLLIWPPTVTRTGPVVAEEETGTVIADVVQFDGVLDVPLNVTVPALPKYCPAIVTDVPTAPDVGVRELIRGGGGTIAG